MSRISMGTLYVVATPIGNLEDLGARAARVLGEVALIAAEDTRHTRQLLRHLGLATPMLSLHDHNEAARVEQLDVRLVEGDDIALVSDAGTPLISDPGFVLVRELRARGRRVVPVPGPCALVAALALQGCQPTASCSTAFYQPSPRRAGSDSRRSSATRRRWYSTNPPIAFALRSRISRWCLASGAWCWRAN